MREEASSPNRQEASFSYFQSVLYDDQTSLIYVMPELRHKYKWFFIRVQMVLDDRRHIGGSKAKALCDIMEALRQPSFFLHLQHCRLGDCPVCLKICFHFFQSVVFTLNIPDDLLFFKFVTIPPAAAQMMTKASIPYFHID